MTDTTDARAVYAGLIDRPHHVSATRPRMPRSARAAQFAPFAALSGYDELIAAAEELSAEEPTDFSQSVEKGLAFSEGMG